MGTCPVPGTALGAAARHGKGHVPEAARARLGGSGINNCASVSGPERLLDSQEAS